MAPSRYWSSMDTNELPGFFPSSDDFIPPDVATLPLPIEGSSYLLPYVGYHSCLIPPCLLHVYFQCLLAAWWAQATPGNNTEVYPGLFGFWFYSTLIHFLLDCCNFLWNISDCYLPASMSSFIILLPLGLYKSVIWPMFISSCLYLSFSCSHPSFLGRKINQQKETHS